MEKKAEVLGPIDGAERLVLELLEDRVEVHKRHVLGPSHFVLSHPERLDLDFNLRPFVSAAVSLPVRASHFERAARNRNHFEFDIGPGDLPLVRNHVSAGDFDKRPFRWLGGRDPQSLTSTGRILSR